MAAQLLQTSIAGLHGVISCVSCSNVLQRRGLELKSSSSSQSAFQFTTSCSGRFGCMKAYRPSCSPYSSPSVATTGVHAHLQAVEDPRNPDDTNFRQQAVDDFVIPRFIPPFGHNRNPLEAEANRAAERWYHHYFASSVTPETFDRIRKAKTYTLPVSVHPTAELSHLEWALEFYLILFLIDDVVEHKTRTSSLEDLEEFFLELMVLIISSFPQDQILQENLTKYFSPDEIDRESTEVFAGKVLAQAMQHSRADFDEHKVSAVCAAFSNLLSRATSEMPQEWSVRFARIAQQSMLSQFLEARNLLQNKFPSLSTYISQRTQFGCMDVSLCITDYVDGIFLRDTLYYSSSFQRLLKGTADIVCWHNDIYSFQKELLNGEMYNLVIIFAREQGISYNKAAEVVNQMVIDKIEEVDSAVADLRVLQSSNEVTAAEKAAIDQYITCCTSFISSTHEFHTESSRFRVA